MPLDPTAALILDAIAQADGPKLPELAPEEARLGYSVLATMSGVGAEVASVVAREIASVPVQVVTPLGEGPFPVLVWMHGGGWVVGAATESVPLCRDLAAQIGCVVVSVDYRLAPEHPYPAAVDDCVAVSEWVLEHADQIGGDPARAAVGGESAGGNLAAVVTLEVDGFVHQLLVCPVTDLTLSHPSMKENGEGYLLEAATMRWFVDHYLGQTDPVDGRISPLHAPLDALAELPPVTMITAEFDPLRDEGQAYADRLAEAGVPVAHTCYDGQVHLFFSMSGVMPRGSEAIASASAELRQAFAV